MSDKVSEYSSDVKEMLDKSAPVRDVIKGGEHLRGKGVAYLPKFPMETEDDYKARKDSTWLFNGVKKNRDDIVSRIMAKPITLKEQEGQLFEWCQNVDMEGRDLSNFSKDVLQSGIESGISFVMADAPRRPEGTLNRGQVQALNLRPYLVSLKLEDVRGWKWANYLNRPVLTQFRICEQVEDPKRGEFDDATVEQIRVLDLIENRVHVRLFQEGTKGEWVVVDEYPTDFDQIYVAPFYTGRTAFMKAEPPLDEMAELNLAHWRVQSDKSSCLHKALSPLLLLKQMGAIGQDGDVALSGDYGFLADGDSADMKWVEITGGGISEASTELEQIKDQMKQMGLQLISEKVGVSTATGDSIDEGKSVARIRMWADDLKDTLEIALGWMVDIAKIAADTTVSVNTELGLLGNMPMSDVKDMYLAGVISRETYINEAKRRGTLSESVSADEEEELIQTDPTVLE